MTVGLRCTAVGLIYLTSEMSSRHPAMININRDHRVE